MIKRAEGSEESRRKAGVEDGVDEGPLEVWERRVASWAE